MSLLRWSLRIFAWLTFALVLLWCAGTLHFSNFQSDGLRAGLALGFLLIVITILARLRPLRRAVTWSLGVSLLVAILYGLTPASNERDWLADVAVAPTIKVAGERMTVNGVRDFRYRSEIDFDERWETREYDLAALRTLDLVMSYWGPTDYCHTFLSFGFANGEQLAVSVETRKEKGESYSTLGGLFKRYELIYVFGDERDLIGVRTNLRGEHLYVYRLQTESTGIRELLMSYCDYANRLAREPEFYGVLANSCGINILQRIADTGSSVIFLGRDALLNGYWDQRLYERGKLDQRLPFEQLREQSRVDERAREAGDAADFSRRIRAGLPGMSP